MFERLWTVFSSEHRAEEEVLGPFFGGDEGCGIVDPRHWEACDATFTVVIVVAFTLVSVLFCMAVFRRFKRFGFEVNWLLDPKPGIGIAVESDPLIAVSNTRRLQVTDFLPLICGRGHLH